MILTNTRVMTALLLATVFLVSAANAKDSPFHVGASVGQSSACRSTGPLTRHDRAKYT